MWLLWWGRTLDCRTTPTRVTELGLALALMLGIEGALYALFPDAMKRMMRLLQDQPSTSIRWTGVGVAALGVGIAWLIRRA